MLMLIGWTTTTTVVVVGTGGGMLRLVTPFIHHSSAGQSDSCRMLMLSMRATDHASSVKLFLFGRSFLANSESLMIIGQSLRAPLGFSDLQKT